jgi:hypothetical protein
MKVLPSIGPRERFEDLSSAWAETMPPTFPPAGWRNSAELQKMWGFGRTQTKLKIKKMLATGELKMEQYYMIRSDGQRNLTPYYFPVKASKVMRKSVKAG